MGGTRRRLTAVLLAAACMAALGITALAGGEGDPTPTPEAAAQALYDLSLFRGTDQGFELERPMTRAEAAVMVVRFLGLEAQALESKPQHPFSDVPPWAEAYVGQLYQSGLTNGTGQGRFSPDVPITYGEYGLMLTRITYREYDSDLAATMLFEYHPWMVFGNPGEGYEIIEAMSQRQSQPLSRGDAAVLSAHALRAYNNQTGRTLAQDLLARGLFDAARLEEVADSLYGRGFAQCRLLADTPIWADESVTAFSFIGNTLYYTDSRGDRHTLLATQPDAPRQLYSLWDSRRQPVIMAYDTADESVRYYLFVPETISVRPLALPSAHYPMRLLEGEALYAGNDTGLYRADLQDGSCVQIHSYAVAWESGAGICRGPDGVVSILADNRILYVTAAGEEQEIFQHLWADRLRWGVALNSYDGQTLELVYPYSVDRFMGGHSSGYYAVIQATGTQLTCIDCLSLYDGYFPREMDAETRDAIVADIQALIDAGSFPLPR